DVVSDLAGDAVAVVGHVQVVGPGGEDGRTELVGLQRLGQPGGLGVGVIGDGHGGLGGHVRPRGVAADDDLPGVDVQALGVVLQVAQRIGDLVQLIGVLLLRCLVVFYGDRG